MINDQQIQEIQKILNYKFKNNQNLKNSLTHPSIYKNIKSFNKKKYNEFERLEFLGDRVLGLVVASIIFNKYKKYNEGELSKKFSYLVQRDFLYKIALELNLEVFLKFNKQPKNNIRLNKSIFADTIESIIGAIFLDSGFKNSYIFIEKFWGPHIDEIITVDHDPKTQLQEISQKKLKKLPEYKLIKKIGPSHFPKFTVMINALNFKNITAQGGSIREAEKKAATKILKLLHEK